MLATSVLLVDSNVTFLRIAARLLQEHYHTELLVVGTSSGEHDALEKAHQLQPRIILLGLSQHSLASLEIIPAMRTILPTVGIIVLGSLDIHAYRHASIKAGADAFIAKVSLNIELLPMIRQIVNGAHPS